VNELDVPWLVLGGSRDTDVVDQPVAAYDGMAGAPERFLEWVLGATHTDWNQRATEILGPDPGATDGFDGLPTSTPDEQVRMLRGWGRLWFEWTLLGRAESTSRAVLNAHSRLRGLRPEAVLPSHSRVGDLSVDSFARTSPTFEAFDLPGVASSAGFTDFRQYFWFVNFSPIDNSLYANFNDTVSVYGGGAAGDWSTPSAGVLYSFTPSQDTSRFSNITFRVAKVQCPGELRESDACYRSREATGLGVSVSATSRGVTRTALVSSRSGDALIPGRSVTAPWAYRSSARFRTFARSVPRTIRVPQRCFGAVPAGFWSQVDALQIGVAEDGPAPGGVVFTSASLAP
jgi:hypothetical protein